MEETRRVSVSDEPNEILSTTRDVTATKAAGEASHLLDQAKRWPIGKIAAGVGIGSAAIAAAVLFANRPGGGKRKG
jgi:hypothetical protein